VTTGKRHRAARLVTDALNPFLIFTALFAAAAFAHASPGRALLFLAVELVAAGAVAGYVLMMRHSSRVSGFWISDRAERLIPAVVLLGAFVGLLLALYLLDAPASVFRTTLSMGLAAATVAAITLFWKASAHCAVAGHAAIAGPLVLGPAGLIFTLVLPLVAWSRVSLGAHTLSQTLAGAGIGAAFALVFLA